MKKRITIFVLLISFVAGGIYLWFKDATLPVDPTVTGSKIFVVNRGDSVRAIANNLKNEGFIRDPLAFFILVKRLGIEKTIQAGDFRLAASMDVAAVIEELQHGTLDVWVTIPEGWRVEEIALKLAQDLAIPEQAFVKHAEEGFMFPDTYLFPKDASASAIAKIMRDNFNSKTQDNLGELLKKAKLPIRDTVILASLVEREARLAEDRPKITSVILNRLDKGMKLDIDATVQYALGYQDDTKNWWKKELTFEDLAVNSSYNTYINSGLPPGPIANPGLDSIGAVLEPAKTNFFYYLSDKKGVTHYATTFEEHKTNINTYLAD